jgi:cobalt/nickel transport system permease protein
MLGGVYPLEIDEHASASWLGRLDARAKLAGIVCIVVVSALLTDPRSICASLVISLALVAGSQLPAKHILSAYLGALPFIAIASLSTFLFSDFWNGLAMAARISACVLPLIVLASGTESFDLFAGLRRLRVPAIITTLLMLTHKYILLMVRELSRMATARRARGFSGGKSLMDRNAIRILANTAGMVFVRSSGRADRVYEGLRARGFKGDLADWNTSRLAGADLAFTSVFLVLSLSLLAIQLGVVP